MDDSTVSPRRVRTACAKCTVAGAVSRRRRRAALLASGAALLASLSSVAGAEAGFQSGGPSRARPTVVASAAAPRGNVAAPVISGWPLVAGSVLSASSGSWTGTPPIAYTYTWKRCDLNGLNCSGGVTSPAATYKLGAKDVGSTVMVTVTASNTAGSASASSVPTARIAAATLATTQRTLLGVHSDLTWYRDPAFDSAVVVADSQILHAKLSRNSLLWHLIEPQQGSFDWASTDDAVAKLVHAGIEPEFTVYGSPSWANGVSTSTMDYYLYVPRDPTAFSNWVSKYSTFLRVAAARYAGEVNLWECGNEENEHYFWRPAPSATQYATWYKACRNAILAGNPQAQVAVGGLTGLIIPGAQPDISGKSFLAQIIAAGAPINHVAIHPYSSKDLSPTVHAPWQGNFDDIGQIRDFLDSRGLQDVDLWVTEWGWSSESLGTAAQADFVVRSLQILRTHFPYVRYAMYFCDFDRPGYSQGLLNSNLTPKPAGAQFARFMADSSGPAVHNLRVVVPGDGATNSVAGDTLRPGPR